MNVASPFWCQNWQPHIPLKAAWKRWYWQGLFKIKQFDRLSHFQQRCTTQYNTTKKFHTILFYFIEDRCWKLPFFAWVWSSLRLTMWRCNAVKAELCVQAGLLKLITKAAADFQEPDKSGGPGKWKLTCLNISTQFLHDRVFRYHFRLKVWRCWYSSPFRWGMSISIVNR